MALSRYRITTQGDQQAAGRALSKRALGELSVFRFNNLSVVVTDCGRIAAVAISSLHGEALEFSVAGCP